MERGRRSCSAYPRPKRARPRHFPRVRRPAAFLSSEARSFGAAGNRAGCAHTPGAEAARRGPVPLIGARHQCDRDAQIGRKLRKPVRSEHWHTRSSGSPLPAGFPGGLLDPAFTPGICKTTLRGRFNGLLASAAADFSRSVGRWLKPVREKPVETGSGTRAERTPA